MQQFVVPQFIDVEDKIIGPVTIRQFIIMLAGGVIIFLAYRYADLALFVTILATVGGGSLVLAFVKVNGQTFHYFILNLIQTLRKPGLRIWNKTYTKAELKLLRDQGMDTEIVEHVERKKAKHTHIRDLSLIVNTGGYYQPDTIPDFRPQATTAPFTEKKR